MLGRGVVICAAAVALTACLAESLQPREYLDQKTAATVTVAAKPLVFAHERPELAAHSREYVTLAATALNKGGAIEYYLFVYFWSTLDRRNAPVATPAGEEMIIAADDRQLRPQLAGHSLEDAGVGTAVAAPPGHWTLHVYQSDLATLHFLSEARQIRVIATSPDGPVTYEPWKDERESLKLLVRHLEGQD